MTTARPVIAVLCATLFANQALGQEEVCPPVSEDDIRNSLGQAEALLQAANLPAAYRLLTQLERGLQCLDTLVNPQELHQFGQQMAIVSFFDQDDDNLRRWTLLVQNTRVDGDWPAYVPNAFIETIREVEAVPMVGPNQPLSHSRKEAVFRNGAVLASAWVPQETPALMQRANRKGEVSRGWWQDGAAFEEGLVSGTQTPPEWAIKISSMVASVAPTTAAPVDDPPNPAAAMPAEVVETEDDQAIVASASQPVEATAKLRPGALVFANLVGAPAEGPAKGWISKVDESVYMPDCPWAGEPVNAYINGMNITVNETTWAVRKKAGRVVFRNVLDSCLAERAKRRFNGWVRNTGISGILLHGLIGSAIARKHHKKRLLKLLMEP